MFCLIKRVLGAVFEFIEIWYKFKMLRKDFRNIFAQMEEYVILYSKCYGADIPIRSCTLIM